MLPGRSCPALQWPARTVLNATTVFEISVSGFMQENVRRAVGVRGWESAGADGIYVNIF